MCVTGPDVVRATTGEQISAEDLGGAQIHGSVSGVVHYVAEDEEDALGQVRSFLAYLPSSSEVSAPLYAYDDADAQADAEAARSVGEIVPASTRQAYDVVEVVSAVVDHGELVQVQEEFAPNVVVGFACFEGHPVGIVANQPLVDAGTLDVDASEKLARFVRFCDAFGLPVVTFVDVPGYRPGAEQEHAGIIRRGAKVSGARFYYLKGWGMRLELALMTAALDAAVAHGFTPMTTPTLVTPQVMGGTGFLGAHSDEIYYLPADDLYLTGTSEVALAGYHADEILDLSAGPKRYMGWSTCYRREAGAAGKDTRGIIRVHQFNKAEMFSYCRPEDAEAEHARLLAMEEEMLALVELPYRVIDTAAGDLGSSAARKFDCEAWLPTQQRWMEVTSTSNCTTYQARRLAVRERREGGTSPVATLNGTLATTRWMVAILENHQQADGSVRVPTGLRPYLGGLEVIEPVGAIA